MCVNPYIHIFKFPYIYISIYAYVGPLRYIWTTEYSIDNWNIFIYIPTCSYIRICNFSYISLCEPPLICLTPDLQNTYIKAESSNAYKEYFGQTAITFKRRFNNHKASFLHINKKNSTTLSHYMWRQRDKGIETNITWEPVSITRPYTRGGRDCSLCLTEKATFARGDSYLMLNKRTEVMNKCRHKLPHMLINPWRAPTCCHHTWPRYPPTLPMNSPLYLTLHLYLTLYLTL